jgi:Spy/CpxP family protein refolding chaperone
MKALSTMLLLLGTGALAQTAAPAPGTAQPPGTSAQTQPQSPPLTREQIESMRAEVRAGKSDLLAKNVSLTSDEAAKFWPLYKQYEAAGKALNDKRFDLLFKYLDAGEKADAAMATNVVKASLQRDLDLAKLRIEYAPKFAKVLPRSKAARVLQVDRALSLIIDAKLASMVPLLPWYPWPPVEE